MRDIFLFFKELSPERIRDAGPSLKLVLDFRKKVQDQRRPFYMEFNGVETFTRKVGDTLSKIGWLKSGEQREEPSASPQQSMSNDSLSTSAEPDEEDLFVSGPTREFLQSLLDRQGGSEAISNVEVARLRLVAAGESRSGNDVLRLGVHDANLLFRERKSLKLSSSEKTALLIAGLKYMAHQNAPFWFWTDGNGANTQAFIRRWMVFTDGDEQVSALRLATALEYDLPKFQFEDSRRIMMRSWFSKDASYALTDAATRYLVKLAMPDDIAIIDSIKADNPQRASDMDSAVIAVAFRKSGSDGFSSLRERDPEKVHPLALSAIEQGFTSMPSPELAGFAKLKSEYVRLVAVRILRQRRALTQELAEELSADSSYDVRLEAILALVDMKFPVSDARARESLVRVSQQRGLGLSGLFMGHNRSDTTRYDTYGRHVLRSKSLNELEELDTKRTPHNSDAFFAACELFPRNTHDRLRDAVRDGFSNRFNSCLERMTSSGELPEKLIKDTMDLREFTCRRQTQAALEILSAQMRKDDRNLLRSALDRAETESSPSLISYFSRYGEWEDIGRIQKLKTPLASNGTLLGAAGANPAHIRLTAAALYKIGRHRFVDLLATVEDNTLKKELIRVAAKKIVSDLSDEFLISLLSHENDDVRKSTAIKCLDCLKKARLNQLLERYLQRDELRYYNSIHWLDLGASMPLEIVSRIAQHELSVATDA